MPINKRQRKARLSSIMCAFFTGLGFLIFVLGFKMAPPAISQSLLTRTDSTLPLFIKSQAKQLMNGATVEQVDAYINTTLSLGSLSYKETPTCQRLSTCVIHFPFVDIEQQQMILGRQMQDTNVNNNVNNNNHRNALDELIHNANNNNQQMDYAVLTRKGFKALVTNVNANQDRLFLISPLEISDESPIPTGPDDFMMGLFDGHGPVGHGTAHFAAMELPYLILKNMQRRKKFVPASNQATDSIKASIKDAFIHLDENLPFLETSGSTAICILRIGRFLFVGNTGDSQAFLVKADVSRQDLGVEIIQSTTPHKPDQPLELARIKASGGQVIPKMGPETSSRVVIPIENGAMTLALAMSRSLGDPEGKKAHLVIADPTVDVIDLEQLKENSVGKGDTVSESDQYFIIIASDGLLDKIPPLEVARQLGKSLFHDIPPRPLVACHELINQASQMWMADGTMGYRDDISVAVKKIKL